MDPTNIPLHARGVLQNLGDGKFEKLSFLTGILRGLLSKHAQVTKASRAGSIFMLPVYTSIMIFVGSNKGENLPEWHGPIGVVLTILMTVLIARALFQLLALPFRSTSSPALFGLVVVDTDGARDTILTLANRLASTDDSAVDWVLDDTDRLGSVRSPTCVAPPLDRRRGLCRCTSQPRPA